jgi:hypothetical protein
MFAPSLTPVFSSPFESCDALPVGGIVAKGGDDLVGMFIRWECPIDASSFMTAKNSVSELNRDLF